MQEDLDKVKLITAKSALHFHENEMPCQWDVNAYRGCGHGCRYCFAQYTHDYLGEDHFFSNIFAKTNIAPLLDRELSKRTWKHARINLSGVTDAYQPAERHMMLMPEVWKTLIRHRNPVIINTKSTLILRDIELIRKLASVASVYVGASITIMDENLRKIIEPGASSAEERFVALEQCREAGCVTNVMLTPVMPYLNDDEANLEAIYARAAKAGAAGLSAWPLNLRGNTKLRFLSFLDVEFPHLVDAYKKLYRYGEVDAGYWHKIRERKAKLRDKYSILDIEAPELESRNDGEQLFLF
jgi:DNA repair photolyase